MTGTVHEAGFVETTMWHSIRAAPIVVLATASATCFK
jgi:hypothetical protein